MLFQVNTALLLKKNILVDKFYVIIIFCSGNLATNICLVQFSVRASYFLMVSNRIYAAGPGIISLHEQK